MVTSETCLSCEVIAGRAASPGGFIFESENWLLTHQVRPASLAGFLILQPRRHVEQIADLTTQEASEMGGLLRRATQALTRALQPEKIYVCSFGSGVKHVHFYLIPRSSEMPPEVIGVDLLKELSTGRWACSDEDAAHVAAQVRIEMRKQPF
ncbi:MAG TPA: HIT family protein [Dehalococcoidia bacterium]|nr:HIT family protein [Dehalococcoidia bacterium]